MKEHGESAPKSVGCAVLTVSDTRNRRTDETGRVLREGLAGAGHAVVRQGIVKDEGREIASWVKGALGDPKVSAVIVSGGTGIAKRDVTVEAVRPLLERELPGFGELFRSLSYQEVGSAAMLSRAFGGSARGKLVLCLPGSPGASRLAMEKLILPELGHLAREMGR